MCHPRKTRIRHLVSRPRSPVLSLFSVFPHRSLRRRLESAPLHPAPLPLEIDAVDGRHVDLEVRLLPRRERAPGQAAGVGGRTAAVDLEAVLPGVPGTLGAEGAIAQTARVPEDADGVLPGEVALQVAAGLGAVGTTGLDAGEGDGVETVEAGLVLTSVPCLLCLVCAAFLPALVPHHPDVVAIRPVHLQAARGLRPVLAPRLLAVVVRDVQSMYERLVLA